MRILLASSLLLISTTAFADSCEHRADRNFDIDPAGLRALVLELGSSDLDVRGVVGLKSIEVRGRACASDPAMLDRMQVSQRREGDRAIVKAEREGSSSWSLFGSSYAYLTLEVRLPAGLALDIQSGSGDAVVRDVAALAYHAGSGDLEVRDVAGDVTATVGSGDIKADDVGRFTLSSTGSGDVEVSGVRGDVEAGHGGSGDLQFERVSGSVHVGDIGSGDVTLRDIGRDVIVESTGSGDVQVDGVRGNLTVRAQGSGETSHRNVAGKVSIPDER